MGLARLNICEDDDAVSRLLGEGRAPKLRHGSRTHCVTLDFEHTVIMGLCVSAWYVNTKVQVADMVAKESCSGTQWLSRTDLTHVHRSPLKTPIIEVSLSENQSLQKASVLLHHVSLLREFSKN